MYIALLTKIKNAQAAGKTEIRAPYAHMDESVLEVLAKNKFIAQFEKKGKNPKKFFDISLPSKQSITDMKFISTPGRRIYKKYTELRPVKQGYGIAVISTSQGIMTDQEAKKNKVGGCVLFYIW